MFYYNFVAQPLCISINILPQHSPVVSSISICDMRKWIFVVMYSLDLALVCARSWQTNLLAWMKPLTVQTCYFGSQPLSWSKLCNLIMQQFPQLNFYLSTNIVVLAFLVLLLPLPNSKLHHKTGGHYNIIVNETSVYPWGQTSGCEGNVTDDADVYKRQGNGCINCF